MAAPVAPTLANERAGNNFFDADTTLIAVNIATLAFHNILDPAAAGRAEAPMVSLLLANANQIHAAAPGDPANSHRGACLITPAEHKVSSCPAPASPWRSARCPEACVRLFRLLLAFSPPRLLSGASSRRLLCSKRVGCRALRRRSSLCQDIFRDQRDPRLVLHGTTRIAALVCSCWRHDIMMMQKQNGP